jgi:DNA-binding response OmpR family regulator
MARGMSSTTPTILCGGRSMRPSRPAAALTAYARSEDRIKVLQSGFQMHLAKPVDPAELVIAVAALAKRTPKAE